MHISVIDDETLLNEGVVKKLKKSGYSATGYSGYEDFMRYGNSDSELYIIDIGLGDGTGFDIIKWLRENKKSDVFIMIISGYGDTQNIIYGLKIGADDYITKPVAPDELIARINAMLRRPIGIRPEQILSFRELSFHMETKEIFIGTTKVHFTNHESLLIELFLRRQGKTISRKDIISFVWGGNTEDDVSDNTINATLSKLRGKIKKNFPIKTIYNQGYILE